MAQRTQPGRFSHVGLRNWKNFTAVNIDLPGRVFLYGPNAAGKSNFLDAFRFLRELATPGGGFQEAVRRRGGVSAIRCLAARQRSDVEIHVTVDLAGKSWGYRLAWRQDPQRKPVVTHETVTCDGVEILCRPSQDDNQDPARLKQTYIEQVNANREFRDLAEFFASVQYLHIVPQLVREPERSVGRVHDPFGGDFLERIAKTPEKTRNARLRRIQDALKVAVPQLSEISLWRDERGIPHLRGKYEHWRPHGAWQNEDQFSDGTLRLMGLLWASMEGNGPLLLEEPELSLHPEIVRYLPQMFARVQRRTERQFIISSHSPEILQDEDLDPAEVLRLRPGREGTTIESAAQISDIRLQLEDGLSLADAIVAHTGPPEPQQLALFEGL